MEKPVHPNVVEFQVTGDYALFSDPLMRVGGEKCSYQIPTYEALKGVMASVYWKPTIVWYIDSVRVMNPIQTEVKGIRPIKYHGGNDLSYYTYLKHCAYQVRAHFEWNSNRPELAADRNENKHHNIARRMISGKVDGGTCSWALGSVRPMWNPASMEKGRAPMMVLRSWALASCTMVSPMPMRHTPRRPKAA